MHAGRPEPVRRSGIDCPESHQAFGTRAKQSTSQLAFGREVKIVVPDTDRNGRTVGEVILPDGRSLNRNSFARVSPDGIVSTLQMIPRCRIWSLRRTRRNPASG